MPRDRQDLFGEPREFLSVRRSGAGIYRRLSEKDEGQRRAVYAAVYRIDGIRCPSQSHQGWYLHVSRDDVETRREIAVIVRMQSFCLYHRGRWRKGHRRHPAHPRYTAYPASSALAILCRQQADDGRVGDLSQGMRLTHTPERDLAAVAETQI